MERGAVMIVGGRWSASGVVCNDSPSEEKGGGIAMKYLTTKQ